MRAMIHPPLPPRCEDFERFFGDLLVTSKDNIDKVNLLRAEHYYCAWLDEAERRQLVFDETSVDDLSPEMVDKIDDARCNAHAWRKWGEKAC